MSRVVSASPSPAGGPSVHPARFKRAVLVEDRDISAQIYVDLLVAEWDHCEWVIGGSALASSPWPDFFFRKNSEKGGRDYRAADPRDVIGRVEGPSAISAVRNPCRLAGFRTAEANSAKKRNQSVK
jgi:hypothetical protein